MDLTRELFTRYFFGNAAMEPAQYDLVVNTARVPIEDVVCMVAATVRPGSTEATSARAGIRVLTLSRELGAGETGFPAALAQRLSMQLYDRELLEEEAVHLGVSEAELEKIDEHPAGIFQRFRPGSIYQRYIEALGLIVRQLAQRGEVVLVGRGCNCLLRDDPHAFHLRAVAPPAVRIRRVMEHRWVLESVAKKLIAESDAQRRSFYESYFGIDWSSPLEYHVTVNSGRLGATALDLISFAAERYWTHTE
jgi:cytidylate kinase